MRVIVGSLKRGVIPHPLGNGTPSLRNIHRGLRRPPFRVLLLVFGGLAGHRPPGRRYRRRRQSQGDQNVVYQISYQV